MIRCKVKLHLQYGGRVVKTLYTFYITAFNLLFPGENKDIPGLQKSTQYPEILAYDHCLIRLEGCYINETQFI